MNIGLTGIWDTTSADTYEFDAPLAKAIADFFKVVEVKDCVDLGCGAGKYTDHLNGSGIKCEGYDGNPNTFSMSKSCYGNFDLSKPVYVGNADAVLSLEVGEHIPRDYELVYLSNIVLAARKYVVMSWFPIPGHGIGHVNERTNEWVKEQMLIRGFQSLDDWEKILRDSSSLWWFSESLLCFIRK
jgi:hypothetical protein